MNKIHMMNDYKFVALLTDILQRPKYGGRGIPLINSKINSWEIESAKENEDKSLELIINHKDVSYILEVKNIEGEICLTTTYLNNKDEPISEEEIKQLDDYLIKCYICLMLNGCRAGNYFIPTPIVKTY